MEERIGIREEETHNEKLAWDAPKLISLDKKNTEDGPKAATYEDTYYNWS